MIRMIKNNIFFDWQVAVDVDTMGTGHEITNNDFYSCNDNIVGSGYSASDNITSNPEFVDLSNLPDGAQILPTSLARDAGISIDGFSGRDYWGTKVPQPSGSNPDIGAHEYVLGPPANLKIISIQQ